MRGSNLGPAPSQMGPGCSVTENTECSPDVMWQPGPGKPGGARSPARALPLTPCHGAPPACSMRVTCSVAFLLCSLKQDPALSESYLTLAPAHTQHHCSQKGIHNSLHMHVIRHTFLHPTRAFTRLSHRLSVHVTHPHTHNTLYLYTCKLRFLPVVRLRGTSTSGTPGTLASA